MKTHTSIEEILERYKHSDSLDGAIEELRKIEPDDAELKQILNELADSYYDTISTIAEIMTIIEEIEAG